MLDVYKGLSVGLPPEEEASVMESVTLQLFICQTSG